MRIAIVDDEPIVCELLCTFVSRFEHQMGESMAIDIYHSAEGFLFEWEYEKHYDLIVLDIEMKALSGIDLARKLKAAHSAVQIIFVTASTDYVFEGFEVGALNYLLKPISEEKFQKCIQTSYAALSTQKNQALSDFILEYSGKVLRLFVKDIAYIEARKHQTLIACGDALTVPYAFHEIEKKLPSPLFIKTHRSYLVNLDHVVQIQKQQLLLGSGQTIPISRMAFKTVHNAFVNRHKEKMKGVFHD